MYSLHELIFASLLSGGVVLFIVCLYALRKKAGRGKYLLPADPAESIIEDIAVKELLDNTSIGVFIRELKSDKYLCFNKTGCLLCGNNDGTTPEGVEKILGRSDVSPEIIEQEDEKIFETGLPLIRERVFYDAKGEPNAWLQINKSLIKTKNGRPLILGTIMDVTRRNLKKIELENVRMELQMALDAGGIDVWVYHTQDKSVSVFHAGKQFRKSVLFYDEVKDRLPASDYTELRTGFTAILNGESDTYKSVYRLSIPGGEDFRYYECRMNGVHSKQTGNLSFIMGVQKDITKEILWQKDLESHRIKMNLAIKSAGIVMWEFDIRTNKFSSPDPHSIVHLPVSFEEYFSMVYSEDVEMAKKKFRDLIEEQVEYDTIEMRILMPDGEYKWVNIQGCISERDMDGRPLRMIGLRRDIDREKRLTKELIELKEQAENSSNLKSAYLANMSHEIRTPLNAIVGFSNLMACIDDPEEKEEYNRIIQTNNELLLQLINDILDLSKIEAGVLAFNYADEDISDIFSQLEQAFLSKVKPGVALNVKIPYEKCLVYTDRTRFIQVISNFLTNACKFTDKGYIEFGYKRTEKGITVYVTDTGVGMTKEQCEKVFDRFMKFGQDISGSGLGMAICDTIIKTFGGTLGVNSVPGEGTSFWAEIPCDPVICNSPPPAAGEENPDRPASAPAHSAGKYDILVAEDNDSNYLLVSKIAGSDSLLRRAHNGAECVEMFMAGKPDVILMDMQMPVMDGYKATRAIRELDKNIPIIAVTANAFDSDRVKALSAGCSDYLTKPLTREILTLTLHKWCG